MRNFRRLFGIAKIEFLGHRELDICVKCHFWLTNSFQQALARKIQRHPVTNTYAHTQTVNNKINRSLLHLLVGASLYAFKRNAFKRRLLNGSDLRLWP